MTTNRFYYIDKPLGLTSFDVLRQLKKKLQIKKMWHTGTLDPLATGGLLVAVWNYTKLIPYFEKDSKEYEFIVTLNWVTESFDSETPVEYISEELQAEYKNNLTQEMIQNTIEKHFTWEIEQVPPKYSALKIWGKKAVDLVRAGEKVEMKKRKATIFEIEILEYNYPELKLRAKVSAGTYIRSIAFDLWNILKTWWYITYLRRTKIDTLDVKEAQKLENFDSSDFYPEEKLFPKEKIISLPESIIERMNIGLETNFPDFWRENWEYFIKNNSHITNIVTYETPNLRAKRKI